MAQRLSMILKVRSEQHHRQFKEDFGNFAEALEEVSKYIIKEKGEEIISDTKIKRNNNTKDSEKKEANKEESTTDFTEVNFEDLGKE